jgi:hypothetical protein
MSPLQTFNHYANTVSHHLDSTFDTGGNSLFKRNIQFATFTYCIALLFQIAHIFQTLSGRSPETVIPILLGSILVLLSGLYLLVIKKRHWLSIYILVVYLIIKQNVMMNMNLSDLPMLSDAWSHVAAFALVFMLGVKKSIVPITLYSGGLILQIYLSLDNSADNSWNTHRFYEFIYIHGLSLFDHLGIREINALLVSHSVDVQNDPHVATKSKCHAGNPFDIPGQHHQYQSLILVMR